MTQNPDNPMQLTDAQRARGQRSAQATRKIHAEQAPFDWDDAITRLKRMLDNSDRRHRRHRQNHAS